VTLALVFLGLSVLALLASIHPLVTYPLSLWLFARRKPALLTGEAQVPRPSVAICMCAYNEENIIVAKAESLLAMQADYGPATIHVYVDGSSDATLALLEPYRDRIDLVVSGERRGKTYGMNQLVSRSESEILFFTDANVMSDVDALSRLVRPFADAEIGCTSARLVYVNSRESATSALGAAYWRVEEALKRIETQTTGLIGVDGAMFAVRRALYRPAPPLLIDDLYTSLSLLLQGTRVVSVESVVVTERSAVRTGEEYLRKMRIACQAMNVHTTLWPQLRRLPLLLLYAYLSHRYMKWLTPFFVLAALLFGLGTIAALIDPLAAIGLLVFGAVGLWLGQLLRVKPAIVLASAIASLTGVAIGVLKSWFTGETFQTWSPASSIRATPGDEEVAP
jgi:cellulose synthase/poly-beta-1,6-N-acetylglucosamine synthase-like glycosyltransferase